MRGLLLASGTMSLCDDLPLPTARKGWSRVRVLQAGICATDQALDRGYMDFCGVPGHEFVGIALDGPLAGKRVTGEINAGCGTCELCRNHDSRHCKHRTVLGILQHSGAFAEQLSLPNENLVHVPDSVSDSAATFVEPLAAALHIADDVDLARHKRALVAGDGKLGLLCAHALALHGCNVTIAGRHPERLPLLPRGATLVSGWLEASAPKDVLPFDLAVDATGNSDVLPRLLALVRPRGTIVIKTTTERPTSICWSSLVVNEQRLIGSRCGRFAPAIAALANGSVPVERWIAARYPLAQALQAFQHAGTKGTLKVLLQIS
ncbi:MAG: alcohol dehydrogenase catalytic domain-containing protein [Planctomycetota bacterium]|nr:alcohol dehydrogenase catalytic domain-containing protein [Planctomycetota bacterium]